MFEERRNIHIYVYVFLKCTAHKVFAFIAVAALFKKVAAQARASHRLKVMPTSYSQRTVHAEGKSMHSSTPHGNVYDIDSGLAPVCQWWRYGANQNRAHFYDPRICGRSQVE